MGIQKGGGPTLETAEKIIGLTFTSVFHYIYARLQIVIAHPKILKKSLFNHKIHFFETGNLVFGNTVKICYNDCEGTTIPGR